MAISEGYTNLWSQYGRRQDRVVYNTVQGPKKTVTEGSRSTLSETYINWPTMGGR